jgi:hypothetical protein
MNVSFKYNCEYIVRNTRRAKHPSTAGQRKLHKLIEFGAIFEKWVSQTSPYGLSFNVTKEFTFVLKNFHQFSLPMLYYNVCFFHSTFCCSGTLVVQSIFSDLAIWFVSRHRLTFHFKLFHNSYSIYTTYLSRSCSLEGNWLVCLPCSEWHQPTSDVTVFSNKNSKCVMRWKHIWI